MSSLPNKRPKNTFIVYRVHHNANRGLRRIFLFSRVRLTTLALLRKVSESSNRRNCRIGKFDIWKKKKNSEKKKLAWGSAERFPSTSQLATRVRQQLFVYILYSILYWFYWFVGGVLMGLEDIGEGWWRWKSLVYRLVSLASERCDSWVMLPYFGRL